MRKQHYSEQELIATFNRRCSLIKKDLYYILFNTKRIFAPTREELFEKYMAELKIDKGNEKPYYILIKFDPYD